MSTVRGSPHSSEKEALERIEDLHENLYYECLDAANNEFKNEKDKNMKKCECAADLMIEKIVGMHVSDEADVEYAIKDISTGKFTKDLKAEIEHKCGKLPKSIKF